MGHDHHFLSRLDRVKQDHAELALALYRDHELVKLILDFNLRFIPEGADRVAIALEDGGQGPHLIVARSGRFVTCLGKGMMLAPEDGVITRAQLDRCAAGIDAFRVMAGSFSNPDFDGLGKLLKRAAMAPQAMAREDMRELVMIAAVIDTDLGDHFRATQDAILARLHRVAKVKAFKGSDGEILQDWFRAVWNYGVFAPIVALRDDRDWATQTTRQRSSFCWMAAVQGVMPVTLRAIWAAGRIGQSQIAAVLDDIEVNRFRERLLSAIPTLLVVALRYPKLQPEVRKLLSSEHAAAYPEVSPGMHRLLLEMTRPALEVLDAPREAEADFIIAGAQRARLYPGFGYTCIDDVPFDVARCLALDWDRDYLFDDAGYHHMLRATPWLAQASPEELFPPRAVLRHMDRPRIEEASLHAAARVRPFVASLRSEAPPRREPGPNEPCSCGSGRKYKKCCWKAKTGGGGSAAPTGGSVAPAGGSVATSGTASSEDRDPQ